MIPPSQVRRSLIVTSTLRHLQIVSRSTDSIAITQRLAPPLNPCRYVFASAENPGEIETAELSERCERAASLLTTVTRYIRMTRACSRTCCPTMIPKVRTSRTFPS
eukprot:765227-Hanusia_phi.AAC.4